MSDIDTQLAEMLIDSGDDVVARRILRKAFSGLPDGTTGEVRSQLVLESMRGALLVAALDYRNRLAKKCESILLEIKEKAEQEATA